MNQTKGTYSTEELKRILKKAHHRFERYKTLSVLANISIIFIGWLLVLLFLEDWLYLSSLEKSVLLSILTLLSLFFLFRGLSSLRKEDFMTFYRHFAWDSKLEPLSYALDLEKATNANPKLVEAAIYRNLEEIDADTLDSELTSFLANNRYIRTLKNSTILIGFLLMSLIFTGLKYPEPAIRLAKFWQDYKKPNPFLFTVQPGNTTVEQGSEFIVSVDFEGDLPENITLRLKSPVETEFRSRSLERSGNLFTSIPFDLNNNIHYYIEMDGYQSEEYEANVQLRPRFSALTITVDPPSYSRMESASYQYPFAQIRALQGSKLSINAVSNKSLRSLLLLTSSDSLLITQDSLNSFSHSFTMTRPDTVHFVLEDENSLRNNNPFRFTLLPQTDEAPFVELIEPSASFEAVEPAEIELLYRASDDFGLTSGVLKYSLQKAFVEEPIESEIKLNRPQNRVLQNHSWDLTALDLKPKDKLTFWVEVKDNDGYNGYKTGTSEMITLTVPSLLDYFDDLGEKEEDVQSDLEDVSESFRQMEDQYREFKEQLKEDPETNYEQRRQLEEVQRQQEEIEKRVEELNEKFEQIKEELSEKNILSEETLQAYQELQKLMEEIDDPAFKEALQKLQENMSNMSPDELRKALEEAEFNEELYKERLERTLELFKQLKLNSDLEKLAQAYEDMARQEEEISNEEVSDEKKGLQRESMMEQIRQLKEQLENLSQNTTDKTKSTISELQEYSDEELNKIREQMEKMLSELRKSSAQSEGNQQSGEEQPENDSQENSESGENDDSSNNNGQSPQPQQPSIQQQLKKLAERTRQTMSQMNQLQMNVNIAGLQYILYSLLELSNEQEELVTYANVTENRSPAYVEYARDQKNVEDIFLSLSDSLSQLSKEIMQFSNLITKKKTEVERYLTSSLTQMAERNQSKASVATRQALGGINEISFLIANLLEQLQNSDGSGSGGGGMSMQQMMEQMQQMGQDQQQINQQIQEMINDLQGERLGQDQMERLDQISRQQNEIRKQLQQLQQNGELGGGDKIGSEIERMIEQMEETINDLRGGSVDPTLVERQQNILSRMLQAEDALQERDEEEKREGTTGSEITRPTPPEMTLEELEKQIRNRLNDPNFTKYSADYQKLIEKYFELLKQVQEKEIQ